MKKMKIFELSPTDSRQSFYGKAQVIEKNGVKYLQSYNTIVCKIGRNGKFYRFWDDYSATTIRHVNSFLDLYGIDGGGKSWWMNQKVYKSDFPQQAKNEIVTSWGTLKNGVFVCDV